MRPERIGNERATRARRRFPAEGELERCMELDAECSRGLSADPASMLPTIRELLGLARRIGERKLESSALIWMGRYHARLDRVPEAFRSFDRAEEIAATVAENGALLARIAHERGHVYRAQGMLAAASELYAEAVNRSRGAGDARLLCSHLSTYGHLHLMRGEHSRGAELLNECLGLAEELEDKGMMALALNNLGTLHKGMKDWERGLDYYRRSLEIAREIDLRAALTQIPGSIACMLRQLGRIEEALPYLEEVLPGMSAAGGSPSHSNLLFEIGMCHVQSGRYDTGEGYLVDALKVADAANARINRCCALLGLGELRRRQEKLEQAAAFMREALDVACSCGTPIYQIEANLGLSEVYEGMGRADEALRHYKLAVEGKERIASVVVRRAVADGEIGTRLQMAEREKEELRSKVDASRQEIAKISNELMAITLNLAQSGEFLARLKQRVLAFAEKTNSRGTLRELVLQIESAMRQGDGWQRFEEQFRHVHHGFLHLLVERHPTLSPVELKVCSLLRVGMSSKEVGAVLGITPATVDLHRVHIRKKLRLEGGANLSLHLASLR